MKIVFTVGVMQLHSLFCHYYMGSNKHLMPFVKNTH